jgi:hypothetical protein
MKQQRRVETEQRTASGQELNGDSTWRGVMKSARSSRPPLRTVRTATLAVAVKKVRLKKRDYNTQSNIIPVWSFSQGHHRCQ